MATDQKKAFYEDKKHTSKEKRQTNGITKLQKSNTNTRFAVF